MAETAVVILNYNGRGYLEQFLPVLCRLTPDAQIILADNASTDDSILYVTSHHPEVEILKIEKNLGYSGGYNYALQRVKAEYFLLVNSDIEVTQGWLSPLVQALKSDPKLAACQPKVLDYNHRNQFEYAGAAGGMIDHLGYPFCRGRIFEELEEDQGQYDQTEEIFWATGACLAIKSTVYHEMGGLDDDFFAHMEEIDLCWRIQRSGMNISYIPESTVYHVGGGTLAKSNPQKTYLNFRNGLAMLYKNGDRPRIYLIVLIRMILDGIAAVKFLFSESSGHFTAVLRAHLYFYTHLRSLSSKRKTIAPLIKRRNENIMIYNRSIIWQYFVKGKRKYSELTKSSNTR